jgi:hypothetical protein
MMHSTILQQPGQQLCEPLFRSAKYDIVAERNFPQHNFSVSLRPLCLDTDLPIIYKWVNQEYIKGFWPMNGPIQELGQTYSYIMESDFAQSFIALVNDVPTCQVDIYHALQDEASLYYEARPGDYVIHLLMASPNLVIPNLSLSILQACLSHFFSYPEVKRVIAEPDTENEQDNKLVAKAGFRLLQKVSMSYKVANLYTCTKENFRAALLK